jgi:MFS family permease
MSDRVINESIPADPPLPSLAYSRYATGLLMVVYMLSFLDRQVLSILAEPIKQDLNLADWQIGAVSGLAFALFYTLVGLPIARLSERGHRPFIIASAITVWSVFTIMCGFAKGFAHLALARVGVGTGEAGCTPPALSLIADYVPRERRSSAVAVYMAGAPAGALLGMVLGGVVASHWGWRTAFFVAGIPGVVMAILVAFTLREPRLKRHAAAITSPRPAEEEAAKETFATTMKVLIGKPTYRLIVTAVTMKALIQYSVHAFVGSFFFRNHAVELADTASRFGLKPVGFLGISLGIILGLSGIAGSIFGGKLADHFARRDIRAHMTIPAIGVLVGTPFYIAAFMVGSLPLALGLLLIPGTLNAMYYGPAYAIVQGLVKPSMRATATAVLLFVISLVGLGIGPLIVGLVSDILAGQGFGEAAGIRWALTLCVLLAIPAAICFLAARKTLQTDLVS